MRNLLSISKVRSYNPFLKVPLVLVMLTVLTVLACSSDATATPEPTQPSTQQSGGNEAISGLMLQLPNVADTVEDVRMAVVPIVARVITQDRSAASPQASAVGPG